MRTALIVLALSILTTTFLTPAPALADCPLAHTHIGVNPTWRPRLE